MDFLSYIDMIFYLLKMKKKYMYFSKIIDVQKGIYFFKHVPVQCTQYFFLYCKTSCIKLIYMNLQKLI